MPDLQETSDSLERTLQDRGLYLLPSHLYGFTFFERITAHEYDLGFKEPSELRKGTLEQKSRVYNSSSAEPYVSKQIHALESSGEF